MNDLGGPVSENIAKCMWRGSSDAPNPNRRKRFLSSGLCMIL